jgi:uncharacterized protein YndB with AHSA1/START domain
MNQRENSTMDDTADREIVITRNFDAPRELVWQAMTDPKHVVHWWGPRGFTTTTEIMDVRPGGVWKHVMHGPDGVNYPNQSIFKEVVKPERIVYSHGGRREGGPGTRFISTWTFDVVDDGKTRVTIRMVFPSGEARDFVVKEFGAIEGGKQTLERLGEHLVAMAAADAPETADCDFVISRLFAAPRELLWKAWTDARHMAQWWGPHAFTNPVCEMDVRPGGAYRIVMRGPDGDEFPVKGVFREIVEPERLVVTVDCSEHPDSWHDLINPTRDKTKKPFLEIMQTVTFESLGDKTKITIRTRFESVAMRDAAMKMGMNQGWSESMESLAGCVSHMT